MSTDLKQLSQCVLSPELAVLAAKELNESPQRRSQALTELRARLRERRDEGDGAQSDSFLLRFLRCKKFDVDRSLCVYERYHTFRQENPGMFAGLSANGVRHIWEAGLLGGLQERDRQGRAVMVAFPGRWDPEQHSLEDVLRALILQLEYLIQSNETQVTGIVLIVDFTDFSFYLARSVRPWYFQLMTALVQVSLVARSLSLCTPIDLIDYCLAMKTLLILHFHFKMHSMTALPNSMTALPAILTTTECLSSSFQRSLPTKPAMVH